MSGSVPAIQASAPGPDRFATARRTLFAYLATVLGGTVFLSVLHGRDWFLRAFGAVTLVVLLGAIGRALRLPPSAIAVFQLVAAFEYLVVTFASHQARGGWLPGRAAMRRIGHLISSAYDQAQSVTPPVTPGPALTLAAVGTLALVAIAVDLLAVGYAQPALAGLPLLILEVVPVSYEKESGRLFLAPALAFLVLLSSRRDRLGPRIGVTVLSIAMLVPATLPTINGKYAEHRGIGSHTGTITTLNPLVTMRRDLVRPLDVDLLGTKTDSAHPSDLYLRTVTLDTFNGVEWKAGKRQVRPFDQRLPDAVGLSPAVVTTPVETQITASDLLQSDYLPMPYPATRVLVPGQWRLDPLTSNVVSHRGRRQITGLTYTVQSLDLAPNRSDVSNTPPSNSYLLPYLQLPHDFPESVARTAREITAGANGPLEIGSALQEWFRRPGNFTYDLRTAPGTGDPAIVDFLRFRRGYCEQFAATMAAMARSLGVPARVDVGFTAGRLGDDGLTHVISAHDAHAWPELWLPNIGWTRFEPTPGTAASNPSVPNWLLSKPNPDQSPDASKNEATSTPTPEPAEAAGAQSANQGQFDCAASPDSPQCQSPNAPAAPAADTGLPVVRTVLLGLLLLLLVVPGLVRELIRRRRWAGAARLRSGRTAASAIAETAWRELRDGAIDLGFAWPAARTPRQCGAALAAPLSQAGLAALGYVTGAVELTRYARESVVTAEASRLRTAVITIHRELGRSTTRLWRIRARMLPMSLWLNLRAALARRTVGRGAAKAADSQPAWSR